MQHSVHMLNYRISFEKLLYKLGLCVQIILCLCILVCKMLLPVCPCFAPTGRRLGIEQEDHRAGGILAQGLARALPGLC